MAFGKRKRDQDLVSDDNVLDESVAEVAVPDSDEIE